MASEEFAPTTETELARFLTDNAARSEPRGLLPVGGRTSLFGAADLADVITIPTAGLSDVVDYPARDMTITVGAGVRIDDLVPRLAVEGQRLPLDVPQSQRATLGGVIATNTSGPRRFGLGTIRDHVIGIAAVDGAGRLFHAGGRVVKNVAGYDLCKLLVGSRGQLAILTTVTLKLRPLPATAAFVWAPADDLAAIESVLERLVTSATRPVVVDVLSDTAAAAIAAATRPTLPTGSPVLVVGFEGTADEVDWQTTTATDELVPLEPTTVAGDDATSLLDALVDYQTRSEDALVVKANITPSRTIEFLTRAGELGFASQAHAANGIVFGHLDHVDASHAADAIAALRTLATASGGNVVVHACDPDWQNVLELDGTPEPGWPLIRRLKQTFDPHGVLNTQCPPAWATTRN